MYEKLRKEKLAQDEKKKEEDLKRLNTDLTDESSQSNYQRTCLSLRKFKI